MSHYKHYGLDDEDIHEYVFDKRKWVTSHALEKRGHHGTSKYKDTLKIQFTSTLKPLAHCDYGPCAKPMASAFGKIHDGSGHISYAGCADPAN